MSRRGIDLISIADLHVLLLKLQVFIHIFLHLFWTKFKLEREREGRKRERERVEEERRRVTYEGTERFPMKYSESQLAPNSNPRGVISTSTNPMNPTFPFPLFFYTLVLLLLLPLLPLLFPLLFPLSSPSSSLSSSSSSLFSYLLGVECCDRV